ncbi:MAG: VWA domain-containing protein [Acidobacteriota bacterium]|nr:VWA domain-containing protein [Acidobacteriota bacterium]
MKRFAVILACLGLLTVSIWAQTSRATRPRVVADSAPPTNFPNQNNTKQPPTLKGDVRPSATPIPNGGEVVEDDDDVIKIETNLVTFPVSVLDRDGRFITGLKKEDFQIFENGKEQQIDSFNSVEVPFTVILMLDVSPSTQFRIDEIQDAAIAFIDQLRTNDKVEVISFDEKVRVLSPATSNRNALRNAIRQAQFGDGTSLYEAVDYVLSRELERIQGRKAVVLFTDGVDTTSRRADYQSTVRATEESEALFFPIRYDTSTEMGAGGGNNGGGNFPNPRRRRGGNRGGNGDVLGDILGGILGGGGGIYGGGYPRGGGSAGSSRAEYETGRKYLEALAQNSGGREFEANNNLDAAFSGIAEELRRQYSLGYYPEVAGTKGDRKAIRVRVKRPNLVVRAKSSYIVGENERAGK